MKKILEVIQGANGEIRFNTDININKDPQTVLDLAPRAAYSMGTRLWGANETTILAVLRTLAIADLSLCVNRNEMVREMKRSAEALERCMLEAKKEYEKAGGSMTIVPPSVKPPKDCS